MVVMAQVDSALTDNLEEEREKKKAEKKKQQREARKKKEKVGGGHWFSTYAHCSYLQNLLTKISCWADGCVTCILWGHS